MKLEDVSVDDLVVVNDIPDTVVYTVAELNGFNAHLTYEDHYRTLDGGWLDVSCLKKPTRTQLENSGLL